MCVHSQTCASSSPPSSEKELSRFMMSVLAPGYTAALAITPILISFKQTTTCEDTLWRVLSVPATFYNHTHAHTHTHVHTLNTVMKKYNESMQMKWYYQVSLVLRANELQAEQRLGVLAIPTLRVCHHMIKKCTKICAYKDATYDDDQ